MADEKQKLLLSEEANVPAEIRRIINNGFYTHHPFNRRCGLREFLGIFEELRLLPLQDFEYCVEAINRLLDRNSTCYGCYGKGLAYVKLVTDGVSEKAHATACERYAEFTAPDEDDWFDIGEERPDYEGRVREMLSI